MKNKVKILVVGSLVMDLIIKTEHFPNAGQTVLGLSYSTAPGGKGANQAVQASRLGAEVTMAGRVGNDEFGKQLVASCKKAGVNVERIRTDQKVSSAIGNVQIEINNGNIQNKIIVVPGANMEIRTEHMEYLKECIENYDMVMLQLEIPMEINEQIAAYAYEKKIPVMLNPAPSAPLSEEMMKHLTFISPNEHETADYTGIAIRKEADGINMDDAHKAVDFFLKRGVKNVVITLGDAGAIVANREVFVYEPCVQGVNIQDPTAAGDSFVGAFATAVCKEYSLKEALIFANFTAAMTVSKIGAMPSLPTLSEVLNYINQMKMSTVCADGKIRGVL